KTTLSKIRYLPDVNVLIALSDDTHEGHQSASKWFKARGANEWILCPLTEAGFVRLSAAPHVGNKEMKDAIALLREMGQLPGYRYWPVTETWLNLVKPFSLRLHGYKQVTDAYLLGLAIKQNGVLVTLDQHIKALAGAEYCQYLLTLE
ncbi:MAG: TA system VapC family ribonuclease toxin, partial [Acidobacteriaceae bacterium]